MKPQKILTHEFVEYIPEDIREGTVYVSIPFATAIHKCCCGCGKEVVTPLSPTDWEISFNGKTISLTPSIGNWNFDCQSHYWIRHDRAEWAPKWSQGQIGRGRMHDQIEKAEYFKTPEQPRHLSPQRGHRNWGVLSKLKKWIT